MCYRVGKKEWTPYNTKYGLILIVLGKNMAKILNCQVQMIHLLHLNLTNAMQCEVFSKILPKTIRKRPILYYRGSILFCLPCIANIGNDKWTNDLILVPSPIKVNHCALCQSECIEFQRKGIPFSSLSILSELR